MPGPTSDRRGGRPRGGGQKGGLEADLEAEVGAEVEALIGPGIAAGLNFEAIEAKVRRGILRLAARAVEQRFNADRSDDVGATAVCPQGCGETARYAGRRAKNVTSVVGDLRLERAYYHCAVCGRGFCPRDRALGIEEASLSPGVLKMVGLVGAMVSFQEGHDLLGALAGIAVSAKQVERAAEALGREIALDERVRADPPDASKSLPPTLYLGVDGTGVPVRKAELVGRQGKQPDGSAKTREVKLCTVWSAEGRDREGIPVRDQGSITYSAAIESAATDPDEEHPPEFTQRVLRETTRRGFLRAPRRVVLGDGAPWIWKLARAHFPDAIQIIDRFHAKQTLSTVAKAIYGPTSDLASAWAKKRHDELDAGDVAAIIIALREHADSKQDARRCLAYVIANCDRMRYDQFRAQGLCTSTGVVEAGCKTVVGTRLKRPGMHWTVNGADAIIALRCCKLSGRFDLFWKRRARNRAKEPRLVAA